MRRVALLSFAVTAALLGCAVAHAQEPKPSGMSPSEAAKKRFPQPVNVGALRGRTVLEPLESQPRLGRVNEIVRQPDGAIKVVIDYGGFFGIGSRPIAVPVEAMVLLGDYMEVVDFKPDQLATFPTFDGKGVTPLPGDEVIEVGLARPSH